MVDAVRRRVQCELKIEADSMAALVETIDDISRRIGMDDLSPSGFSAGYNSSYRYRLDEDESITHDSYFAAIRERE
jgi:hypothetical protein